MSASRHHSTKQRLQKVMAHAGVASRRRCEEMIQAGRVRVNGDLVTTLGTRVDPDKDQIEVDGRPIRQAPKLYYALYKPTGVISTVRDPHGRPTARALVPTNERVYPVGRLDQDSEGLMLFTNDGALAQRLMHPRYEQEKQYYTLVSGIPTDGALTRMREGLDLPEEERPMTAEARRLDANWHWRGHRAPRGWCWLDIVLREGRKREIRRLLRTLGYEVQRLVRARIGTLEVGDLQAGQGHWLTDTEIAELKRTAGLGSGRT